jgi:hypothetical protein
MGEQRLTVAGFRFPVVDKGLKDGQLAGFFRRETMGSENRSDLAMENNQEMAKEKTPCRG